MHDPCPMRTNQNDQLLMILNSLCTTGDAHRGEEVELRLVK
jgi:hypothetical protein